MDWLKGFSDCDLSLKQLVSSGNFFFDEVDDINIYIFIDVTFFWGACRLNPLIYHEDIKTKRFSASTFSTFPFQLPVIHKYMCNVPFLFFFFPVMQHEGLSMADPYNEAVVEWHQ